MEYTKIPSFKTECCNINNSEDCKSFAVSQVICNHMVLQREKPICLWGFGSFEGQLITATIGQTKGNCTVDENLDWLLELPPMETNTLPQKLIFSDGRQSLVFDDVLIGDVWVISGQSNAEFFFNSNAQIRELYDGFLQEANAVKNIRLLEQKRLDAVDAPYTMETPQKEFANPVRSKWKKAESAKAVENFSVIGYSFAEKLAEALENCIPIGMIMAASDGSAMMELMPMELVEAMGYVKAAREDTPLAGMYNALMSPIQNMTIKGMIFYQGESEQWRHKVYPYQLNWYVEELRRRFKNDLPFYYVQISSHGGEGFKSWNLLEEVRYRQLEAMDLIKNSHMAVSMDVGWREGDCDWAHPHYKRPVGQRLALLALAKEYGIGSLDYVSSPMPVNFYWAKDYVKISFNYVGDGLKIMAGNLLTGFEVQNECGSFEPANAQIVDKDTVVILGVQKPIAVRYAHMHLAYIENANLGNSEGLPAPAFKKIKKNRSGTIAI